MRAAWQRLRSRVQQAAGQIIPVPVLPPCPPVVRILYVVAFAIRGLDIPLEELRRCVLRAHAQARWRLAVGWV